MKKSRDVNTLAFIKSILSFHKSFFLPILGPVISLLIPTLPGCESVHQDYSFVVTDGSVTTKLAVPFSIQEHLCPLDILVFNNDSLQRLDCYQRIENPEYQKFNISSQNGDKIILIYANSQHNPEDWMWINTYAAAGRHTVNLEYETRDSPAMSGELSTYAGDEIRADLTYISSEIILNTLTCNFKGKPYEGEKLTDVSIYLTNVNAECQIWENGYNILRFINQGRLCEDDVNRFADQSMIYHKLEGEISDEITYTDLHFRCYPNPSTIESPGSPFTRLVIEGKIQGRIWYWPIAINRNGSDSESAGIERNNRYIFDICITGKGSADPDTEIERGNINAHLNICTWREKESYIVTY